MVLGATILMFFSIVGIASLFGLKWVEVQRGAVFFPTLRAQADTKACQLKAYAYGFGEWAQHLPHHTIVFIRVVVHIMAVTVARAARVAERGAHQVADFVSHKNNFERRETNSEFLRQVTEHKNGLGSAPKTTARGGTMGRRKKVDKVL